MMQFIDLKSLHFSAKKDLLEMDSDQAVSYINWGYKYLKTSLKLDRIGYCIFSIRS